MNLPPRVFHKDKLSERERKTRDDAKKKRDGLRKKLQHFIARIPAFMYLTDDREKTIRDIITRVDPGLFATVTGLDLNTATTTRGGWTLRRDERIAALVDAGVLKPGTELIGGGTSAVLTENYGMVVDGIRYDTSDDAAAVATAGALTDGWAFWHTTDADGTTLDLLATTTNHPVGTPAAAASRSSAD